VKAGLDSIPAGNGSFDKVFMLDVIEHLNNMDAVLNEIKRVMKPHGQFIIITPNYGSYWKILENAMDALNLAPKLKDYQHVNPFTLPALSDVLKRRGFKIEKLGTIYGISPFLAKVSAGAAEKLFGYELSKDSRHRALIYCVAGTGE
jgi:ubiquinone/menaquinone biosynthesis C-methylase UbiE